MAIKERKYRTNYTRFEPEISQEQINLLIKFKILEPDYLSTNGKLLLNILTVEGRIEKMLLKALGDKFGFKTESDVLKYFKCAGLNNLLKVCLAFSDEVHKEGERRSYWRLYFKAERQMQEVKLLLYKMKIIDVLVCRSKKEIRVEDYKYDIILKILQKEFPDDVKSQLDNQYEYSLKTMDELLKIAKLYFDNVKLERKTGTIIKKM